MFEEIVMPLLGSSMEEGYIVEWLKSEGDKVSKGEALLKIETDKAVLEAEAHYDGILHKILVKEGESAEVGEPIAVLVKEGEEVSVEKAPALVAEENAGALDKERTFASPLARKLAYQEGIDLKEIEGSGPEGRIIKADIENRLPGKTAERTVETIKITETRKKIAEKTRNSKQEMPHYYVGMKIYADNLISLREQLKANELKISINDFILKAVAVALNDYPILNSSYREDKGVIEVYKEKNIGMIIGREEGVLIPVIRNIDKLSLKEIAGITTSYIEKVRANKVVPDDLTGGTFTVSNMGMYGVSEFTAVINPPEAAILAVGGVQKELALEEGEVVEKSMFKVMLSLDHRVIDGVVGAQFLQKVKVLMENPMKILF